MTRDPRVDPRPGDVVKGPCGDRRAVDRVSTGPFGDTRVEWSRSAVVGNWPLALWRYWARNAEVMVTAST